ncbi:hypothetical protein HZH68_007673 [Vespula germanica]|uniref:GCN5-related N-acetyltransferase Rv2170-like domain-containing protein n=1 Tax=Vespula germanica TaxID=30212 RepID=A0A834K2Z5_VESGE|nr:hypothetical protein HZH68_007673 [Vespula germanica]
MPPQQNDLKRLGTQHSNDKAYLTKRVAERGYNPFVVIRPENEASQSLYKKLGFRKLFQTVRMIFTPLSWQETENEASNILRENLENAVRQLNVEQRVIAALRGDEDNSVASTEVQEAEGEETIREGGSDSNEEAEVVVEEPEDESYARDEEILEPIEEQEERIDVTEEKEGENEKQKDVVVVEDTEGAPNVDDSNEGDGGTDVANNDD